MSLLACAGARMRCIHSKGALAACVMEGVGAAKGYRRGVELAIESAAAGSMYGLHTLAVAHREGVDSSAPRDDARALILFSSQLSRGQLVSCRKLVLVGQQHVEPNHVWPLSIRAPNMAANLQFRYEGCTFVGLFVSNL